MNAFLVAVHNKYPPLDEEWDEWLQFNYANGLEHGTLSRYLIVTEGGIPTTAQRKIFEREVAQMLQKQPTLMRTAVVSPSTFIRGVVTGMNLLSPIFRAFPPEEMNAAYEYLGVPPVYVGEIESMLQSLKAALSP